MKQKTIRILCMIIILCVLFLLCWSDSRQTDKPVQMQTSEESISADAEKEQLSSEKNDSGGGENRSDGDTDAAAQDTLSDSRDAGS